MNEDEVKFCSNCKRDIPLGNFVMHNVHCLRNLALCTKCDEAIPRVELQSHNASFHSTIECPACGNKLEKMNLEEHQRSSCKRRPICCNYCHIETEANELSEHENYCGSRTERCEECGEFVMMKYQQLHEDSNHGFLKLEDEPGPTPSWVRPPPTVLNDLGRQRKVPNAASDPRPAAETNRLSPSKRTNDMPQVNSTAAVSQPKALHKPVLQKGVSRPPDYPNKHANVTQVNSLAAISGPKVLHKPVVPTGKLDDSDVSLDHLLALRLSQQEVPAGDSLDHVDAGDLVALPCEFCEAMVPANQLVMHETGCRPDLACFTIPAGVPDVVRGRTQDSGLPCEFCKVIVPANQLVTHEAGCRPDLACFTLAAGVPHVVRGRTQDSGLPCEFCEGLFPPEDLLQHQALCDSTGPDHRVVNQLGFPLYEPNKVVKKQLNLPEPRLQPQRRQPSGCSNCNCETVNCGSANCSTSSLEARLLPLRHMSAGCGTSNLNEMRAALEKPLGGFERPNLSQPFNNVGGIGRATEASTGAVPKQKARSRVTLREVNQEASRTTSPTVVPTTRPMRPSNTNLQR